MRLSSISLLPPRLHEPTPSFEPSCGQSYIGGFDEEDLARHQFSQMHPLRLRRHMVDGKSHLTARPHESLYQNPHGGLAFTIDGGETVVADVGSHLPSAMYPWVQMGYGGDTVTLRSVHKWTE